MGLCILCRFAKPAVSAVSSAGSATLPSRDAGHLSVQRQQEVGLHTVQLLPVITTGVPLMLT